MHLLIYPCYNSFDVDTDFKDEERGTQVSQFAQVLTASKGQNKKPKES